ncbi:glycolate oxidase subunit GlcE [Aquabacterium sp. OR-4]|nr:glycolate oxidase subunit GlcE [Aquabacterium sp. OR-4]MDT7837818.1 glycolate oxidase subunit GlcE [Aquabacterium sp. OR-4]
MATQDLALQRLIDQVRGARSDRLALNIAGGGTKAFYGGPITGLTLDVRPLAGISAYEPSELVVTARAGTPLAELEAALAERGQCLPFEPPRFALAGGAGGGTPDATSGGTVGGTVGGMVAAGLAGPSRAAVGSVRDYMLGATLLNGRGELMSFGGQVMKNVAGYDVSRLLAGSMGVLGVICEVSLKVLPVAPASITLRFEWDEATALQKLNEWGGQPLPVNASAWWSGMLVLRLSGAAAAVQSARQRLGGEVVDEPLAAPFWQGLRDHSDEFFQGAHKAVAAGATLWRLSVPQTAPVLPFSGEHLVEWGGAQRWVATTTPAAKMREAAARVGGHATAFAGDKGQGAFTPLAPALATVHRRLKHAFDPDRLFNRGRLFAEE